METVFVVDPKRQRCGYVADIPLARRCGEFCQQSGKVSVSCSRMILQMDLTNDCLSACCGYVQKGPVARLDLPV